jgi:alkylation response protein AidB-like acyl-CoA dehydrogenase
MDFTFGEAYEKLRIDGSQLARSEAGPSVVSRDRARDWDPELFITLTEGGIGRAFLPQRYGGLGLTALETLAFLEGFGEAGDAGLALSVGAHGLLCAVPIWKLGTEAQKGKYLPKMASGLWVGGLSLLELEGGSTAANLAVRAVQHGRDWILDGTKTHVVNAPVANHYLVTAVTDPAANPRLSAFLIDRGTPGLRVQAATETSVMRTCPMGELALDRCRVPAEALLGTVGAALFEVLPLVAALDRTCVTAPWLGLMRALSERTMLHALEEQRFSRPLTASQSVRATLADMTTRYELSAGLLYRAAWQLDQLARPPRQDSATAKLFVASSAQIVARDAARIHGLLGFDPHYFAERAYRDSIFLTMTGGGEEVLRPVIAGSMLNLG